MKRLILLTKNQYSDLIFAELTDNKNSKTGDRTIIRGQKLFDSINDSDILLPGRQPGRP